jgi:hypothetical protein
MKANKGNTATISRKKLYPTPGTNPRVAWKWLYSVSIDGGDSVEIGSRVDSATGWAKRRAANVVKAWEQG